MNLKYIMRACLQLFLTLTVFAFSGLSLCSESYIHIVTFNGVKINAKTKSVVLRQPPGAPLKSEYFLKQHDYWPDKKVIKRLLNRCHNTSFTQWRKLNPQYLSLMDESFLENLSDAKMLYIGQYNQFTQLVFKTYSMEIKRFLEKGGVVFFDYLSGVTPALNKFLGEVKVANPCSNWKTSHVDFVPGTYIAVPTPKYASITLLNKPWPITNISAYGYWTKWSKDQITPLQNIRAPGKSAALIIQEKVLGKGKIIFNSIASIFRSPAHGGNSRMLQNLLSYIIGENILEYKKRMLEERGGPGEPVDPR